MDEPIKLAEILARTVRAAVEEIKKHEDARLDMNEQGEHLLVYFITQVFMILGDVAVQTLHHANDGDPNRMQKMKDDIMRRRREAP